MICIKMDFSKCRDEILDVITEENLKANPQKTRRTLMLILGIFLLCYGVFGVVRFYYNIPIVLMGILCLVVGVYAVNWSRYAHLKKMTRRLTLKNMKKQERGGIEGVTEYMFSEEGVFIGAEYGHTNMTWEAFKEWEKAGDLILIKGPSVNIIFIDTRQVDEQQLKGLESLLQENIK